MFLKKNKKASEKKSSRNDEKCTPSQGFFLEGIMLSMERIFEFFKQAFAIE
jgi:hypothetical protein